jgi:hypothetical protein
MNRPIVPLSAALTLFILTLAAGAAGQGTVPPENLDAFPAVHRGDRVELAARLLTPDQVSGRFVSELNRGYLVVEVALVPKETPFEVNRTDFALRSSQPEMATGAQSAELAAATLQRTAPSSRGVRVMPQVGIGYETGSGGRYDPATRTYGRGGLTTSVGVGVGLEESRPGATEADREVMTLELREKGLPEGLLSRKVSGYLYFPWPETERPATLELEFNGDGAKIRLELPVRR